MIEFCHPRQKVLSLNYGVRPLKDSDTFLSAMVKGRTAFSSADWAERQGEAYSKAWSSVTTGLSFLLTHTSAVPLRWQMIATTSDIRAPKQLFAVLLSLLQQSGREMAWAVQYACCNYWGTIMISKLKVCLRQNGKEITADITNRGKVESLNLFKM